MTKRTNTAKWLPKTKRWKINVQKDGDRRSFYSSLPGRTGQRECNAKADSWLDEGIEASGLKVCTLFDKWLKELKITTSRGHWAPYESYWNNWIKPHIGSRKIENVNEQHLQDIILDAFQNGNAGVGMSHKSLKNLRDCMAAFFKYARKGKKCTLYLENVTLPKNARKSQKTILQPSDIKLLFSKTKTTNNKKIIDEWFLYGYRFEVVTGLRPGEIVGLMNTDIEDNILTISRAINVYNETTGGKNENAQRRFVLPKIALNILKEQSTMLKMHSVISPYTFPWIDGKAAKQSTYYVHWKKYRDYNGITKTTPYELRHTFISANKELPGEMVKLVAGHSEDFDTQGVYGHELDGEAQRAARLINRTFTKLLK